MKALRQFLVASVLILTLSLSAVAGDMTTGIASPQPTPATTEGDIHTGITGEITTMNSNAEVVGDSVTVAALSLIQSVLSLF
ncbi:MAG TPA: hypothetical protein VM914_03235 [Pyrinomonadaceae bacterium]|jgi:hypothetical protein|nr:hypothetical protein [Pyrinomonadaceae bacterium]